MSESMKGLIKTLREVKDICNDIDEPAAYNSIFEKAADNALNEILDLVDTALGGVKFCPHCGSEIDE